MLCARPRDGPDLSDVRNSPGQRRPPTEPSAAVQPGPVQSVRPLVAVQPAWYNPSSRQPRFSRTGAIRPAVSRGSVGRVQSVRRLSRFSRTGTIRPAGCRGSVGRVQSVRPSAAVQPAWYNPSGRQRRFSWTGTIRPAGCRGSVGRVQSVRPAVVEWRPSVHVSGGLDRLTVQFPGKIATTRPGRRQHKMNVVNYVKRRKRRKRRKPNKYQRLLVFVTCR